MSIRAIRTRLKPGMEESYKALHATVPDWLATDLVRRGNSEWLIFRHGQDLFHVIFSDDADAVDGPPIEHDPAWHAAVAEHLEPVEGDAGSVPLELVWSLTENGGHPPRR